MSRIARVASALALPVLILGALALMGADVPPGAGTLTTTPVSGLNTAGKNTPIRVTDGGSVIGAHVPMCFSSDGCIEITATQSADGGTALLVPGQWYDVQVTGDKSGDIAGCWVNGAQPTTCTAKPRLKDLERRAMAFTLSYPGVDAGAATGKSELFFLSATTTAMTFVACPQTACQ